MIAHALPSPKGLDMQTALVIEQLRKEADEALKQALALNRKGDVKEADLQIRAAKRLMNQADSLFSLAVLPLKRRRCIRAPNPVR